MSEQTIEARTAWCAAWAAAWSGLQNVTPNQKATIPGKNGKPGFSYEYADLATVVNAVRPILALNGLAVSQEVVAAPGGVGVVTMITHREGGSVQYGPTVVPFNGDARAAGGAITYARRYALAAALGIAVESDTDAHPTPPMSDPVNWHQAAWRRFQDHYSAQEAPPEEAIEAFKTALLEAGLLEGEKAEDEDDFDRIVGYLIPEGEDGSGY